MKFSKLLASFEEEQDGELAPHNIHYKVITMRDLREAFYVIFLLDARMTPLFPPLKRPNSIPQALKKLLKMAAEKRGGQDAEGGEEEERRFISELSEDVRRCNTFFEEKEEEAVIRLQALEERLAAGPASPSLKADLVDFHGEMVLLLHWSMTNYAAVAKILKKHDKLMDGALRAPFLGGVLQQPFLKTESISRLLKRAEQHVATVTGGTAGVGRGIEPPPSRVPTPQMLDDPAEASMVRRTRAALGMLDQMQSNVHTPSTFFPR
jgi:hypothetical protein